MKQIPTYIINLEERKDRLKSVLKQFENRPEFKLNIVTAVKKKEVMLGYGKQYKT
ncbi:hypothetical protein GCM10027566_21910 [Arachidicoccus ginsenosidivorans]